MSIKLGPASTWTSLVLLLSAAGPGSRALAYQNPDRFAASVGEGGGGERYFTASLVDSYGCSVCHASPSPPWVTIAGLPETYVPGTIYRVVVDWPDELGRVGVNMELTDLSGQPLGQWLLPDDTTLTAADRCSLASATPTGVNLARLLGRTVVTVAECGQHQATLDWRAPDLSEFPRSGWFSGSLLSSNHDGELGGDEAADFSRALFAAGQPRTSVNDVEGHCDVAASWPRERGSSLGRTALLASAAFGLGRSRRRRRRRSASPAS